MFAEMNMKPFEKVNEALEFLDHFKDQPEDLELPISDLLQDPVGVNMAIIGDKLLSKGFWPNGFIQMKGYRIYRFMEEE